MALYLPKGMFHLNHVFYLTCSKVRNIFHARRYVRFFMPKRVFCLTCPNVCPIVHAQTCVLSYMPKRVSYLTCPNVCPRLRVALTPPSFSSAATTAALFSHDRWMAYAMAEGSLVAAGVHGAQAGRAER